MPSANLDPNGGFTTHLSVVPLSLRTPSRRRGCRRIWPDAVIEALATRREGTYPSSRTHGGTSSPRVATVAFRSRSDGSNL